MDQQCVSCAYSIHTSCIYAAVAKLLGVLYAFLYRMIVIVTPFFFQFMEFGHMLVRKSRKSVSVIQSK